MTQRRDLARGGMISFLGSATSALLGFVLTIVFSRLMGAHGAGVIFQATGVFAMVLAFAKLGLDSTAIYLLPRLKLDSPDKIRSTITAFVLAALAASVVLVGVLEAIAPLIWDDTVSDTIRVLMVFVPVGALFLIASAVLRALGSVTEYVLVSNVALPALRPPLVAVAAVATGSIVVVAVAWALPLALLVLVAGVLVSRHIHRLEEGTRGVVLPSRDQWRTIAGFAAPRTLSAGLEQALIWVDVLLVGWLVSDEAAGVYGGAARFIQAGLVVDAALRVVVSPKFSSLLHQAKTEQVRDLYVTATMWLVLIASPAYVLLAVFSPVFLALLGPEFVSGAAVLSILAVGMMLTFMAGNIHSLLIMSGRSGWAAVNKALVLAINIVGNLLVLPHYGIVGAAAVWALSMLVDALLAAIEVRVFLNIRAELTEIVIPLGIVGVTFGIPAAIAVAVAGQTALAFLATVVVGGIAWLAACRVWRSAVHVDGLVEMLRSRR
ncbi:MAG: oligosaccharide flippase family protein [Corynebacterium sp.]|uniref:oligosaccharide flippase family protein n=1 Tax=Corynebacterium sp. TaxID=1720 RepID=UPI0026DAD7AF|nr:oligosaccharide flippase family protein [Corynebacterium sp.]MDO5098103.1 oligosaccharide flippase family protein [Corynebacterium sp.]